jgi:hypothetical protein
MIKAMNTIINKTGYPIFMPNQVLKNNDLNSLVSYLDSQNRLTRTHLIGMGIICGMEVSSSYQTADAKISISAGCGITSEGYVISLSPITLTHYQSEAKVQSLLFAPSEDVSARSSLQYTVIELFEQSGDKRISLHQTPEGSPRDAEGFGNFLADQVLLVVCETQDEQRNSCLLEYDDLGKYRNFRWRFFLLPRVQKSETPEQISAETLLRNGYQIDQLLEPWKGFATEAIFEARNHFLQEFDLEAKKFQDFAPQVQRFGYVEADDSVDLTKINDYKSFRENYYQICVNAIAAINNAFPKLFWLFSPFFTTFQPSSGNDFGQLKENLEKRLNSFKQKETTLLSEKVEIPEAIYTLQYFYDYLSQLVAAYYELAEAAFDLMDDCTPDTRRFPKFLMLGLVPAISSQPNTAYRSDFTQPPIYNGNQVRVKQVRYLYERLLKLCAEDSFYLLPFYNTPLKITPSKEQSTPLSEQAIPYYLNYPNLYQYWNYDVYRKGRSDRHPAYFYPKQNSQVNPHVFNDLTYRLDAYNFYRIEGHIGKANGDALKHIQEYRQRYNLAFDVITLKLGSLASLQDLNISGQFDDLESDFSRIKDTFQKLWTKYKTEWSKNVFLQTLKQFFFDKPRLTTITSSQLFNPILEIARKPEAHEFVKGDTDLHFQLFVRDETNTHIARFVTQIPSTEGNSLNDFNDLIIDFSGLASDAIAEEKQRIANEIAICLSLSKVTYGIVIDSSSNTAKYHLKLSTEDVVNLPSSTPQYSLVLLSLNHFAVSIDNNNYPAIKQSEFQDFETLYSLLRDVPEEFNTESYHMGNSHAAEELNYFEIKGLINAYQQRLEQLMKLHLFHKFSEQHPGMEHLGGVPKGGTFILVYVDGEEVDELLREDKNSEIYYKLNTLRTETIQKSAALPPDLYQEVISSSQKLFQELQKRKDIVVGDFCLPYRCGSDTPAINYVVARPRPVIILEKTVFCEGDRKKYQFTLEPEGGTVKGEGVVFEGIKQLFQPSSIDQASIDDLAKGLEVAITFAYAVDDTYDTLTVTIYPLPRPHLSISNGQNFCRNAEPVEIKLANGTPENIELIQVKINEIETNTLNPAQYATEREPETLRITALIRDRQTQCENTLSRTVTINPVPEADLSITGGENFCHNADVIEITLAKGTPENVELIQVSINDIQTRILNPSLFAVAGQSELVKIEALIRDRQTQCENTLSRTVTINPVPEADFQAEITNINEQGFSVRVFNIQPAEKSFSFVWEHPRGSSNISNPNSEFIITYNFDFNTWVAGAEVSINLRVNTPPNLGNCSSEPVTRRIAIPFGGVVGFNLLTISNNEVINTTALESDPTFRISDFNPNNEYAIASVTIPATVGSVIFTYTAPNGSTEVNPPVNARPYHLPNWQPLVGIHRITAQAFREINGDRLEGTASTVTIQINDDNNGEPDPTPNQPTPKSVTISNRLRLLFDPSDQDIAEFKSINHEDTIKPSQVIVLEQPRLDRWTQSGIARDKNFIFSALTRQSQLGKLLVISAASLLLIAGWTYTIARQSQGKQNSQPSSDLRF